MNYAKYFGQHHLIDKTIITKIIENANINSNERICEMGSGKGEITFDLCKKGKSVQSFEIDNRLYRKLMTKSICYKNLELINQDILKYKKPLNFDIFISNIPYSRSRDIFSWLATQKINRAVILVQREFAEKILSKHTSRNYRAISAITQYCFDIQQILSVAKNCFNPQPSVESIVIKLNAKNDPISKELISLIHYIFSFRNKRVRNIQKKKLDFTFENTKVKDLEPENIVSLAKMLMTQR
jgi:16S rRNA (adenine1518-N6/adenine1519-N6)-dimethyltransferase